MNEQMSDTQMTEDRQQMTNIQNTDERPKDTNHEKNLSPDLCDLSYDGSLTSGFCTLTSDVYVTASVLLEYLFCPRFIYFMNCLCIDQNEDKRFKVLKGREVHEGKERVNIDYLRKRIGCVGKEIGVYMTSEKYHIKGESVICLQTLAWWEFIREI